MKEGKKIGKMDEAAWVIGIFVCSLGVCLCTKADFGLSMIAAPPYILHYALRDALPWLTQGRAEYLWQAVLLLGMCAAVRRFRWRYLLSFAAAFVAGKAIGLWFVPLGGNGAYETMAARIAAFAAGEILTALAIAFVFRTSWPVQIYELLVRELADRFGWKVDRVKMANDVTLFFLSAALSFALTRGFHGFGAGTVIITAVNAPLIALFGKLVDRCFTFGPLFPRLTGFLSGKPAAEGEENGQEA